MVTEMPKDEWFDIFTQGYLLNMANAIEDGIIHSRMDKLEEIRSLYQKDALTGIYNRRGFDKLLRERFASAKQSGENFGIASIDMDNLKYINDNIGHAAGDEALKAIADSLAKSMEDGEFCARIGGDEFAAVLDTSKDGRKEYFRHKFNSEISRHRAELGGYEFGASVGISELAEDPNATLVSCLQKADMRMYEDKRLRKSHR